MKTNFSLLFPMIRSGIIKVSNVALVKLDYTFFYAISQGYNGKQKKTITFVD